MQVPERTGTEAQAPGPSPATMYGGPLVLSDVYLLTSESNRDVAVPGLTVQLDATGLTVRKPDGAIGATVAWAEVSALVATRRMRTPAGHQGVVVEAITASRAHQFVVPSDNPDGLEYEVNQLAAAVLSESPDRPRGAKKRSRVLVGTLVVIILAGIALAVLVAIGTVKF